jgi:hypothetical protein
MTSRAPTFSSVPDHRPAAAEEALGIKIEYVVGADADL